jgi:pimeloyl-ACP methyl ester carboxylesterase
VEQVRLRAGEMSFDARLAGPEDGEAVVLLHGFPQTSWCWRFQMAALAQAGYRALAPDQRGYSPGACPSDPAAYRMDQLVADALAFAEWTGAERVHFVGHDWGGAVAWHVAGRHPDRVASLAVVSTPHPRALLEALGGSGDQASRSSYMSFFRTPEEPERALLADEGQGLRALFSASGLGADEAEAAQVEAYVRALLRPGAMTGALNWYRAMRAEDSASLGPVTCRTLYVWSTEDVALGREAAEATGRFVEGPYRFEVLEGVSHWVPEQASGQLNRLLLEHLGRAAA